MNSIESYEQLVGHALRIARKGRKKHVVAAAAQDLDVIEAVVEAQADGFLEATLVGDAKKIELIAEESGVDLSNVNIVHEADIAKAAHTAVRMAADKKADAVMKGFLPTSALLKTILDTQYNLRGRTTVSHCAVLDIPGYHKLVNLTDGGMVVSPDLDQKMGILENAVTVASALGISPIRVAVAGPSNVICEKLPRMVSDFEQFIPSARKRFVKIQIDGPYPLDIALHKNSAVHRRIESEVAGNADILLFDSIEACNITCKTLINLAGAIFAGVIVGAKVPISLVSRTDTARNKKASLAIACILADYYQQQKIWEV